MMKKKGVANMKKKFFSGIIIAVVGILLIFVSAYIKSQIGAARETVQKGKGLFSKNPIGKSVGGFMENAAESKIRQYESIARFCMYGGIVLIIVGGALVIFSRKK